MSYKIDMLIIKTKKKKDTVTKIKTSYNLVRMSEKYIGQRICIQNA